MQAHMSKVSSTFYSWTCRWTFQCENVFWIPNYFNMDVMIYFGVRYSLNSCLYLNFDWSLCLSSVPIFISCCCCSQPRLNNYSWCLWWCIIHSCSVCTHMFLYPDRSYFPPQISIEFTCKFCWNIEGKRKVIQISYFWDKTITMMNLSKSKGCIKNKKLVLWRKLTSPNFLDMNCSIS